MLLQIFVLVLSTFQTYVEKVEGMDSARKKGFLVGNLDKCSNRRYGSLKISKTDFFNLVEIIRPYAKERSNRVREDVID